MASRKSNNAHYRNADLKRPFDNIKEAMGLTGNADSNYYTNLGKVSRYEGSELENRKKENQAALILEALASTTDPVKRAGLGHITSFTDSGTGESAWQRIPGLKAKGESEAAGAKSEAEFAGLITSLAKQLAKHEKPDIADYAAGPGKFGGTQYEEAIKGSAGDFEQLVRKIGALKGVGNAPLTAKQRSDREGSGVGATDALRDQRKASEEAIRNLGVANVAVANKRVAEIAASMKNAGQLTSAKLKEIQEKLLIVWQESFYRNGVTLQKGKLLDQTIKTELQKTLGAGHKASIAQKEDEATGGKLYLDKRALEEKLETLKEKRKEAKSDAEIAQLNQEYAKTLKLYEVETKKQNKLKATTQTETAGIKQDTATAQKERAVNLASMSKQELDALPKEIIAKAQELQVRIRKGEQQIKLATARTGDVNRASDIKIMQKAHWNNKLALQKLLSPYIQQKAKADASNAAGKFAQDTSKIMLKDQLKQDAKTSDDKVNINPEHYSWTDWSNWFDSMDVNKKEYAKINGAMFKHKDRIQSGSFPEKAKNAMIADIITSLQVEPSEAKKIYAYTIKSFGK